MSDTALRKGDRTRTGLVEAAVTRFAREGFRGTSVADVCRDAGLSTTASYPYFANKEALFLAAVDEDVAGLIDDAVHLVGIQSDLHWGHTMMLNLMDRLSAHPLARRIVSGLEPEFTMRLLDMPALDQLRKSVAELMRSLQVTGEMRTDVDAEPMASGIVVIVISLLMAIQQTGGAAMAVVAQDIETVLDAATRPPS